MRGNISAFEDGVKAYLGNIPRRENPHAHPESNDHVEWDQGWCEAYIHDPEERNSKAEA